MNFSSNEQIKNALREWVKMRTGKKVKTSAYAMSLALNKLSTLTNNENDYVQIINNSIMSGWTSFYPLRRENRTYHKESVVPEYFKNDYEEQNVSISVEERKNVQAMLKNMGGKNG